MKTSVRRIGGPKAGTASLKAALLGTAAAMGASLGTAAAQTTVTVTATTPTPVEAATGDTINIAEGVTVSGGDDLILVDNGADDVTVNNDGTLVSTDADDEDTAIFVDFGEENTVINNGATGVMEGEDGVVFIEGDATVLNNSGRITGTGDQSEGAVYIDRDAQGTQINNMATGVIEALDGGPALGIDIDQDGDRTNDYTIVNDGIIRALDPSDGDADGVNFNGDPGGSLNCDPGGGTVCTFTGTFTNNGTISSLRDSSSNGGLRVEDDVAFAGTLTNNGTITGVQNGIRIGEGDHTGGLIANAGTITATDDRALRIDGDNLVVNNLATGVISGPGEGLYLDSPSDNITVTNDGRIDSGDVAVSVRGTNTTLTNNGLLVGTDDLRSGVFEMTSTGDAVTLVNAAGGVIRVDDGFSGDGVRFDLGGAARTIGFANAGAVLVRSGDGVQIGAASGVTDGSLSAASTFSNSGTITSETGVGLLIDGVAAGIQFVNTGTISGGDAAVDASGAVGAIVFVQDGGALDGLFIGSAAGTDTLAFRGGAVTLSHDVTNGVDVSVASGTELIVSGARAIDGSLVSDGTLAFVLGQDSLAVSGDATLSAGSTVAIADLGGAITAVGDEFTLLTAGGTLTNGALLTDRTVDPSFLLDFELVSGTGDELLVRAVQAIEELLTVTGGSTEVLDTDLTRLTLITVDEGGVLDIDGARSANGSLVSNGVLSFDLGADSLFVSGDVTLEEGSVVAVTDIAGNVTAVGDRFTLLTAGGELFDRGTVLRNDTMDDSFLLDFVMVPGLDQSLVVEAVAALRAINERFDLTADITDSTAITLGEDGILNVVGERSIEGSLVSDGTLQFTLGVDSLAVSGDVTLNDGSAVEIADLNGAVTAVGDQFTLITAGGDLSNEAVLIDVTEDRSFLLDFVVLGGTANELRVEAVEAILGDNVITDRLVLDADIARPTLLTVASGGVLDVVGARSLEGSLVSNGTLQFALGTDSLAVSGDVTLTAGSTVEIADMNGAVTGLGQEFTLITAGGVLSNRADLVDTTEDASFLVDFDVVETDPQSLTVRTVASGEGDSVRGPAGGEAQDPNLSRFNRELIGAFYAGEVSSGLFASLAEVPDRDGFDAAAVALLPSVSRAVPRELFEGQQLASTHVDHRLRGGESGAWGQVTIGSSDQDADGGRGTSLGYDADGSSFTVGLDAPLSETLNLGVMAGRTMSEVEHGSGSRMTDIEATHLTVYAGTTVAGAYATAQLGYSFGEVEDARAALGEQITARSEVSGVHGSVNVGIDYALGERVKVTPLLGMHYARWDQTGYREAGGLNLRVDPRNVSIFEGRAGARLEAGLGSVGGNGLTLSAHAIGVHDFVGDEQAYDLRFGENDGRSAFLQTAGLSTERVEYGVAGAIALPNAATFTLSVEGETSDTYEAVSGLAHLRVPF